MPTREVAPRFLRDYSKLSAEQRERFLAALAQFVQGLRRGRFAAGLRVKVMAGTDGIWEMTWAPDGRATFEYGAAITPGEPHVIWRRIGTHAIFRQP